MQHSFVCLLSFCFVFFFLGSSSSVPVTGSVCLCTCTSRLCDDMVSFLRLPNHYFTLDFQRAQLPVKLNLNCYKQATKDIKFLIETVFESLLYYRKKTSLCSLLSFKENMCVAYVIDTISTAISCMQKQCQPFTSMSCHAKPAL